MQPTDYDRVAEARDFLAARCEPRPKLGIILGTGLGALAKTVEAPSTNPYDNIPHWPRGAVTGHDHQWIVGLIANVPVAVLSGRTHLYEGFSASEVAFGVRVLGMMGVRSLILTNASGAVNEALQPGSLALIADHINLQGTSPLSGPNEERWGRPFPYASFPDMTNAYDAEYRRLARDAAAQLGVDLPEGVYAGVPGPNYETPAEIRYLRSIGADLVGMSTVQETIAARHMGIRVLGLSVISNLGAGLAADSLSHEEVLSAGESAAPRLTALLQKIIPRLAGGGKG